MVVPYLHELGEGWESGTVSIAQEHFASTLLRGRFVIRPCIVSHRTHKDRIDEAIEIVRSAAAELDR